jgi:hypothetical protein
MLRKALEKSYDRLDAVLAAEGASGKTTEGIQKRRKEKIERRQSRGRGKSK